MELIAKWGLLYFIVLSPLVIYSYKVDKEYKKKCLEIARGK